MVYTDILDVELIGFKTNVPFRCESIYLFIYLFTDTYKAHSP